MKLDFNQSQYFSARIFLIFFIISSQTNLGAQEYIATYRTNSPTIDGQITPGEWQYANTYSIIFYRTDGNESHTATLYLQNDSTWLYVGVESEWNSGWDVYMQLRFDGNNDDTLNGNSSEPHTDIQNEYPSPGAWGGYNNYQYIVGLNAYNTTPPTGTQKGSYGNTNVNYEFSVKISDLNLGPDNIFGFFMMHGTDGTPPHNYEFPLNNTRDDPTSWHHVLIASWTSCPGTPTVLYEGKTYNTVQIGNQCWLKENLDVGVIILSTEEQTDNDTIEKYCYENIANNCDTLGGLYQWQEIMEYLSLSGSQGICPDGWHIPTDEEFKILEGTVDSQYGVGDPEWDKEGYRGFDAGKNLKSTSTWLSNGNGTDLYGYTALPSGMWYEVGNTFRYRHESGIHWSSDQDINNFAWRRLFNYTSDSSDRARGPFLDAFSVRCLKDTCSTISASNAGPDQISIIGTSTMLAGNSPLSWETGLWSIASGTGGTITDPSDPTSAFSGTEGTWYELVWTISNSCNHTSRDTVTISFNLPCPGLPTVDYEGKTYNTVQIGTQCWLKENLDVGEMIPGTQNQADNDTIEKYCYNNVEDSCSTYGGLYQWDEMMSYSASSSSNPSGVRGICPSGWHIPSDPEWIQLTDYLGGLSVAGGKMKESGTEHWNTPNFAATNESGFKALPGGIWDYVNSIFPAMGIGAWYWSSTEGSSSLGGERTLNYNEASVGQGFGNKSYGFNARCIKDSCSTLTTSNAGPDQISLIGTSTLLAGSTLQSWETGTWSIASGTGGNITDPSDPTSAFSGTEGSWYELVWTISNSCNHLSRDTVKISFNLPCTGVPTIDYEGKTYNTAQIGTQCWFKENLNVGTRIDGSQLQTNNSIIEKYCYNDSDTNCSVYGGLYLWDEMMEYVTTPGVKGICPQGWHIPVEDEWCTVTHFLDPTVDCNVIGWNGTNAGGKMKETDFSHWNPPNIGATNESGFSAIAGGYRYTNSNYYSLMISALFWSSTQSNSTSARGRDLRYNEAGVGQDSYIMPSGFSVRCLKDTCSTLTAANAGPDQISIIGTSTMLAGNSPVSWETGLWSIASGTGGTITDPSDPTSAFSGTEGAWYDLVWMISNSCNHISRDTVKISFNLPCPGLPTIQYAGETYNTVQIGTQCWLKENLDIGTMITGNQDQSDNSILEKYCYNNEPDSCTVYGGLYQWGEVMNYASSSSSNPSGVQGICPSGWHMPSDLEWTQLTDFLGGETISGGKMKEAGTLHWLSPNTAATNSSNYSALPGGYRNWSGINFGESNLDATFWSTTEASPSYIWRRTLKYNNENVYRGNDGYITYGYGVRCLKNICSSYDTVSVIISVSSDTICAGDSATFTATPAFGGSTPVYQWRINSMDTGSNSSTFKYMPLTDDTITCILTSSDSCVTNNPATSNEIIISIAQNPVIALTLCWPITSRDAIPYVLKGGIPLNGIYSGTGVQSGIFYPGQVPPGQDTVIIRYQYTNAFGCYDSDSAILTLHSAANHTCGDLFTDVRDNQEYATIQLGNHCWLAENLNYGSHIAASNYQQDNCQAEKFCFEEATANCTNFGGLYQWDEMMDYQDVDTSQGLCPPGWHIPSETEWQELIALYQDAAHAGTDLKSSGTSGFNALLKGFFVNPSNWKYGASDTTLHSILFWTSTLSGQGKAWAHGLNIVLAEPTYTTSVSSYSASRVNGFAVRCIKDE